MNINRIKNLIDKNNEIFRADYLKAHGQKEYDSMMSRSGGRSVAINGKASGGFIALVEKKLNVTFCKDYYDYLLNFGCIDQPPADRYIGLSSDDEAEFKKTIRCHT